MEKTHYAIAPEVGKRLIEWGFENRPEGMRGARKSQRAQISLICEELLDIANKKKQCTSIIQTQKE